MEAVRLTGLKESTLKKYAKSFNCECDPETGEALYFHRDTIHPCDYACNGQYGFDIAEDINHLGIKTWRRGEKP